MNIGKMSHRITLQPPTKTADGMGGFSTTWAMGNVVVWAEFKKPKTQTADAVGTVVSDMTREIHIRYRPDVRRGWRVVAGARTFEVEHTYDIGRETTVLVCRELVK